MTVYTQHVTDGDSSLVREIYYNPETEDLGLVFDTASGIVYTYRGIPADVASGLIKSGSRGSYYNAYIKGRYSWVDESTEDVEVVTPKSLSVTVKYSVVEIREVALTLDQNGDLAEQIQQAIGEDSEILGVSLVV